MTNIYFKESQKFNMGWKWIVFIVLYSLMIWSMFEQLAENKNDMTAFFSIVFSLIVIAIFNMIIIMMKLETNIDETSIRFQFKPFHIKPRIIKLGELQEYYVREFKPLKEYGGYGIQRKMKYGRSYTVSGRNGLQMILKNGKKILIGTQKPKELQLIVEKLKS